LLACLVVVFCVFYPTFFIGFDIVPLWFEFISEGPQELSLNSVIKNITGAVTENLNITVAEKG